MQLYLGVLLLGACSFTPGTLRGDANGGGGGGDGDAPADGAIDAMLCATWSAHHFDACAIPLVTDDHRTLPAGGTYYTFDTTNGGGELRDIGGNLVPITSIEYMQSDTTPVALWTVTDFTLASGVELYAIGTKPLVIASWGAIDIAGVVDGGSYQGWRGAGADPAVCASNAAQPGQDGSSGNGGGGGGGFGGNGGNGASGDGNCGSPPGCYRAGGMRGTAVSSAPSTARGGCNGAASGASGGNRAGGGYGGGAIILATRTTLTITGTVRSGGAGGAGDPSGSYSTGGGGGGSGGLVGLDAGTSITVTSGTLAAHGGGGGGGADIANTGTTGTDAVGAATAGGGPNGPGGTSGGSGSALGSIAGSNGTATTPPPNGGGGGGGGGAGLVLYWSPTFTATSSTQSPSAAPGP